MTESKRAMLHPTVRALLLGARDEGSPLFLLGGHDDVLSLIWRSVTRAWASDVFTESLHNEQCIAFAHIDTTEFPAPSKDGRNVNMMPFLLGDVESLPEDLRCYWPMIEQCTESLVPTAATYKPPPTGIARRRRDKAQFAGHVGYLTVQESVVHKGASQRRPGLHTEGFTRLPCESGSCVSHPYWHSWGFGRSMSNGKFKGGIFMASNVDDSCHVYNALVPAQLIGRGGDIEHLRATLQEHLPAPPRPRTRASADHAARAIEAKGAPVGDAHMTSSHGGQRVDGPISLQANELFWMTDRTPHQSMPLAAGTHRMFFRLVAGKIDSWFAAHSTPNPLGTLPQTRTVDIDKFTGRVPRAVHDGCSASIVAQAAEGEAGSTRGSCSSRGPARHEAAPLGSRWRRMRTALLAAAAHAKLERC